VVAIQDELGRFNVSRILILRVPFLFEQTEMLINGRNAEMLSLRKLVLIIFASCGGIKIC
jgi:hypothetical protein